MSQCGLPNKTDCNSPHIEAFLMNFGLLENCTCHLLKSTLVSTPCRSFRSCHGFSTASCLFFPHTCTSGCVGTHVGSWQHQVVLCTLCCQLWPAGAAKRTQRRQHAFIFQISTLSSSVQAQLCVHLYLIHLLICTTPSNSRWGYLCLPMTLTRSPQRVTATGFDPF